MLTKYLRLRQLVLSISLIGFLFVSCGASQFKPKITEIHDYEMQLYIERDSLTGEVIAVEVVMFKEEGIRVSEKYNYPSYTKYDLELVIDKFLKASTIDPECLTDEEKEALDIKKPYWGQYRMYYAFGYLKKGFQYVVSLFV